MTPHKAGWFVFVAALGMTLGLLGSEIAALPDWSPVATPAFIGKALIHLGTVAGAFIGGKLIPTSES